MDIFHIQEVGAEFAVVFELKKETYKPMCEAALREFIVRPIALHSTATAAACRRECTGVLNECL